MKVHINGAEVELQSGARVPEVLSRYGADANGRGIAVAVNGEVIARSQWDVTEIREGDRVEVLGAIGGG